MPEVLRFGIHSLDELLGIHPDLLDEKSADAASSPGPCGIYLG